MSMSMGPASLECRLIVVCMVISFYYYIGVSRRSWHLLLKSVVSALHATQHAKPRGLRETVA